MHAWQTWTLAFFYYTLFSCLWTLVCRVLLFAMEHDETFGWGFVSWSFWVGVIMMHGILKTLHNTHILSYTTTFYSFLTFGALIAFIWGELFACLVYYSVRRMNNFGGE